VHFGIEHKLRERGIFDNEFSSRLEKKIEQLLNETKAKTLIINGDVKDRIGELDEITAEMLDKLRERVSELILVKGNHDGGIEAGIRSMKLGAAIHIVPADGFAFHGLGIFHGNAWPSAAVIQCKNIISAHQHPQIEFRDKMGKRHVEQAWLIAEVNEAEMKKHYEAFNKKSRLVLMPAFNPLVGSSVNKTVHLGPVLNNNLFKLDDALVFRSDGALIGKLNEIK
jgi:putative SbcD/Mre11-related phosphoesterase